MRKGMKSSAAIDRVHAAKQFRTGSVTGLGCVSGSGGCIPNDVDGDTNGGEIKEKEFHAATSTRW